MEKEKLTKSFIMDAYGHFMKSAEVFNGVVESVNDKVREVIGRSMGMTVCVGGRQFVLDDCDCIISTFGNYIDLFFICQRAELKGWRPDEDLSAEDQKEDLRLMREYIKGKVTASVLFSSLVSDVSDMMLRIRMEPTMEEVADICEKEELIINN